MGWGMGELGPQATGGPRSSVPELEDVVASGFVPAVSAWLRRAKRQVKLRREASPQSFRLRLPAPP